LAANLVASHALDCSCASFEPSAAMESAAAAAHGGRRGGNVDEMTKITRGREEIRWPEEADSRML
jgi:hypothetical protein